MPEFSIAIKSFESSADTVSNIPLFWDGCSFGGGVSMPMGLTNNFRPTDVVALDGLLSSSSLNSSLVASTNGSHSSVTPGSVNFKFDPPPRISADNFGVGYV